MKPRSQSAVFYTAVLFGAITCMTGCATTGVDLAAKTGNSIQTVETGMARGETKTGCATNCDLK